MNESNINRSRDILEIDLWKLLLLYLRRWRLILLCALAARGDLPDLHRQFHYAAVSCQRHHLRQQCKGESAGRLYQRANLATSQQLVNTYVNIIRSDTVLEKVVKNAKLDYSAAEIRGMMTTAQVDETELFSVYISHPDPEMAAKIANAVATVAPARSRNSSKAAPPRSSTMPRCPRAATPQAIGKIPFWAARWVCFSRSSMSRCCI